MIKLESSSSRRGDLSLSLGRASMKFFTVKAKGLSVETLISGSLQALFPRWSYLGGNYLQGAHLQNLKVLKIWQMFKKIVHEILKKFCVVGSFLEIFGNLWGQLCLRTAVPQSGYWRVFFLCAKDQVTS